MNDSSISEEMKRRFAEVVKNYKPKVSDKWQKLLTLETQIAGLRSKKASYRLITELLLNMGVSVSHSTVARFCRNVLESGRSKSQRCRASVSSPSRKSIRSLPKDYAPQQTREMRGGTGGPRVADPQNI